MSALLTDNLPLLAGAPNGIQKLRELILELAVRGKLVPQDPSDEPASELLNRIAEEKALLVAEGKIRKQKPLAEIGEEEKPFDLPEGWSWVRLGEIQTFTNGFAFKSHDFQSTGIGVVRIGDVKKDGFISTDEMARFPDDKISEIDVRFFVEPGDLVITMTGDVKLAFNGTGERLLLNQRVGKICIHEASPEYIYLQLVTQAKEKIEQASGSVISNVSTEEINNSVISLPPLPEQHRIVAKVDELMALCDRLEARQADAESAHARLVQALLDSLTQASDADDFAASWQRLAEHFHSLFTSESSIDALKQTLLQLAVMGKLVPQDPSDEPASELLKRIAEEKARLVVEGKIKKQKPLAEIGEDEKPFELPVGWEWVRLGQVSEASTGHAFKSSEYKQSGTFVLRVTNINPDGTIDLSEAKYIDPFEAVSTYKDVILEGGDILLVMVGGSLGKIGIVDEGSLPAVLNQNMWKIFRPDRVARDYLVYGLRFINSTQIKVTSSTHGHLAQGEYLSKLFPLAPEAEQHRIVAKVEQLMSICDQLKARLTATRQLHERLAGVLVEQAVA